MLFFLGYKQIKKQLFLPLNAVCLSPFKRAPSSRLLGQAINAVGWHSVSSERTVGTSRKIYICSFIFATPCIILLCVKFKLTKAILQLRIRLCVLRKYLILSTFSELQNIQYVKLAQELFGKSNLTEANLIQSKILFTS